MFGIFVQGYGMGAKGGLDPAHGSAASRARVEVKA